MTSYLTNISSYIPFGKSQPQILEPESIGVVQHEMAAKSSDEINEVNSFDNEEKELPSNKKTDEIYDPSSQPNILWRVSSGIASGVTGTVGMGVGSVKWVAEKGYDATAAVGNAVAISTKGVINKVTLPAVRKKAKNEWNMS